MDEKGRVNARQDWPVWILLAAMLITGLVLWPSSPQRMPVHWDVSGEPDRYGSRFEALLLMPLLAIVIYLGMVLLPRIDPGRSNYRLFSPAYRLVRIGLVALLAVIYFISLAAAFHPELEVIGLVPVIVGAFFVVIGNVLPKVRPNWFLGVRTPWTLSSRRAWNRTHRIAGPSLMVLGVLLMPLGYLKLPGTVLILVGLVLAWLAGIVAYSYVQWKRDPDPVPPANTEPAEEVPRLGDKSPQSSSGGEKSS